MAGRSDIKAGSAFIELSLKDSFTKGLRNAGKQLKDFGAGMGVIGASIGAAGAAITGPLVGALHHFAEFGSTLNDMSVRTGIAASSLAELGYAAELSGTDLAGVEKSVMKMQKAIGAASDGNLEMRGTFRDLGVSIDELRGLAPEAQFELLGEKVAAIANPTERAATAMKVFGKSGTQLLPMLADLKELRQEAKDLGIAPDDAAVKAADELGDAYDRAKKSIGAVIFNIGGALAGAATTASNAVAKIAATVGSWAKRNQGVITTIAAVGTALTIAGGAIAAVGATIFGLGAAFTFLASTIGVVSGIVAALASPLGIIGVALAGGAALWVTYTESGRAALGGLMEVFNQVYAVFKQTFGGIQDALSGGELMLAGQIAMAGLNLAFQVGLNAINEVTGGAVDYLRSLWDGALSGITFAVNNWKLLTLIAFQSASVSVVSFANDVAHFLTEVIPAYLGWFGEHWREVFTDIVSFTSTVASNIFTNLSNLWTGIKDLFSGNGFTFEWTPLTKGFESAMKDLPAIAERQMGPLEKEMRDKLAALGGELETAMGQHTAGRAPAATQQQATDEARKNLDDLTTQASKAKQAKDESEAAKKSKAIGEVPEIMEKRGNEAFSTFSAAALAAGGVGGEQLAVARKTYDELREANRQAFQAEKQRRQDAFAQKQAIQNAFRLRS